MPLNPTANLKNVNLIGEKPYLFLNSAIDFTVAGTAPVRVITFASIPVDASTFTLSWNGGADNYTFSIRNTPDESGLQLRRVTTSLANCIIALRDDLNRHWAVYRDFVVTSTATTLVFTARNVGTAFNTTFATSVPAVITSVQSLLGVDRVMKAGYEAYCTLEYWKMSAPSTIYQTRISAKKANASAFLIPLDDLLDNGLYDSTLPDIALSGYANQQGAVLGFRLRYAERFGTPPVPQQESVSSTWHCIQGGQTREQIALTGRFNDRYSVPFRLMYPYQGSRQVFSGQRLFSSMYCPGGIAEVTLRVNITHTDGTTLNAQTLVAAVTPPTNALISWAFTVDQVEAIATAGKTVRSFHVYPWVDPGASPVNGFGVTFELNRRPVPAMTQLVFMNSLGVFESVAFFGEVNEEYDFRRQNANRDPGNDKYDQLVRADVLENAEMERSIDLFTGYRSKQELAHLVDLCLSKEVYMVANGFYRPVKLGGGKQKGPGIFSGGINAFSVTVQTDKAEMYV